MGESIGLYWRGLGGCAGCTDVFCRFSGSNTIKANLHKRKENIMRAEKIIIEMEQVESKRQERRLSTYRDKMGEMCKDTAVRKEGDADAQGRE
ncbi:MAG: hypothetical protein HFG86_02980 [Dorea sp.]|nr:hypothetical protein [Dorea sp.]